MKIANMMRAINANLARCTLVPIAGGRIVVGPTESDRSASTFTVLHRSALVCVELSHVERDALIEALRRDRRRARRGARNLP